jgi:hypothetical protein
MAKSADELMEKLSAKDVLRIDPVHEYELRLRLRQVSEKRLKQTEDESDTVVERGRPTGP